MCECVFVFMFIHTFPSFNICKPTYMFTKSQLNKCLYFFYLGCYLSVWHCYLGSILAFNIEIQISYNCWTKPLNQLRLIYEQFIYVLYLDLVIYIYIYFLSSINSKWWIDWLIDWLIDWMDWLIDRVPEPKRSQPYLTMCIPKATFSFPGTMYEYAKKSAQFIHSFMRYSRL